MQLHAFNQTRAHTHYVSMYNTRTFSFNRGIGFQNILISNLSIGYTVKKKT
jgi:hypothetical protein